MAYSLSMKRFFPYIILLLLSLTSADRSQGQQFGNEWIHFGNTYKKIKISASGIYRINYSTLSAMGFGSVSGSRFALFREGREVPIFTSTQGTLSSGDYIEFYGYPADGKMDTELYLDPAFQPNTEISLLSDTAAYFLTHDNTPHQRLQQVHNPIPTPAPTPAAYCWVNAYPVNNIRTTFRAGRSYAAIEYFYASDYDIGEGYSYVGNAFSNNLTIPTPAVATAAGLSPILDLVVGGAVNGNRAHSLQARINNQLIYDTVYNGFDLAKGRITFSASQLNNGNSVLRVSDNDRHGVFKARLRYPRTFNFSGNFSSFAKFELPASERYLELSGFSGGAGSRLYDLSQSKIITGDASGASLRFYLDPSSGTRELVLAAPAAIREVTEFQAVQFIDYSQPGNQGDYLILSSPGYLQASPNYLGDYRSYRASMAGGGYTPVLLNTQQLYDQFGFGFDFHPIAIKNFIRYARQSWTVKPEFLFIVGKGITYTAYRSYMANSGNYSYDPVPTWGHPGADVLFSDLNNNQKPVLATGRLSAWNNDEIGRYLEKVRAYEAAVKTAAVPKVASDLWKKSALHIAGASDTRLQSHLLNSLNAAKAVYEDTLTGGRVHTIAKNSTDPVDEVNSETIDSIMNAGLDIITFYGHASSSGFDYNLNSPDNYQSKPRFPAFFAFGCDVAHIFNLSGLATISENYIRSENGGSIVMIAGNNYGYTSYLPTYKLNLYRQLAYRGYGQTLGEQYKENIAVLQDMDADRRMDIHTQSLLYQGDPAIRLYQPDKPDYAIEESQVSTDPGMLSTALNSFELQAVVYNLGKAVYDSVWVSLSHTRPGNSTPAFTDSVLLTRLFYSDTVRFTVPIDPNLDIGMNNYTLFVDALDAHAEISEQNNRVTLQYFIYSDNLVPVYPQEFAIVTERDITLKASTLNAFAPTMTYRLEMDTTEAFSSPLKVSTSVTQSGGVIKWRPGIPLQDSLVYYWRTAVDSAINGQLKWTTSSFVFLENGTPGWNQSHFFQFKKDAFDGLRLEEPTRVFDFAPQVNVLTVENKVVSPPENDYSNVRHSINDIVLDNWGCGFSGSVQILIIDGQSGQPWTNTTAGLYGSLGQCTSDSSRFMYEFRTNTLESRNNAMTLIDNIPEGDYVLIKNLIYGIATGANTWDRKDIYAWMADTAVNGSGKSLYHSIKDLGFDEIDQFTSKKSFAFFRKKGDNGYPVYQKVSVDSFSKIEFSAPYAINKDTGVLMSNRIGPARNWKSLKWKTSARDNAPQHDKVEVLIYGLDINRTETLLRQTEATDLNLDFIDAQIYPEIRLSWNSVDTTDRSSAQLEYWRVLYDPVPEAALNAGLHKKFQDSLHEGQQLELELAIENLSNLPMDSMLVRYKIIDEGNQTHTLGDKRYKPLQANDTLIARFAFDPKQFPGKNYLFIEANPDQDQPEQYHPNNLGYLPFHLNADNTTPLLDVTFDGVHILDKDLVSAKPFINILLKDDNLHAPLNDSLLMTLQLVYPDESTPQDVPVDGTICRFIPADTGNLRKNEASIEFKPVLEKDGVYKLLVHGKDRAGNIAGNSPLYEIHFTVENKPSVTHVLNYPNPFSTSTQFVFTLTGSEIPSQFKIQILTITGKIVKEITKAELGFLHIGRNITEYRWDGRDQYGQLLGNGVYLYRVITSIRGEEVEHRKNATVDKFFKNGYGKLYIMR